MVPQVRGILWRTAILSWLVAAITLGLFALFLIPYQRSLLVDRLQSAAEVAATSISEVTVSSIVVENYGTVVDHCLKVVSERPAVQYIVITKGDGFSLILLDGSWRYAHLDGRWLPPAATGAHGDFRTGDLVGEEVYHYAMPLQYSGIDWGWIHLGLSLREFRAAVATIHRRSAVLALSCVLVGFVASLVFARQLTRPIRSLTDSADRIARGDLTVRAEVQGGDEVGRLAASFNEMTQALQATRDGLEATVQERTQELRAAEERWRSLVQNAPDLILTVDLAGTILLVSRLNPVYAEGCRLLDCLAPEHRDSLSASLDEAVSTGAAQTLDIRGGLAGQPKGASVLRIGPIMRDGVCGALIIIATDITERVAAEERIIHLERLGALGEMAAGVSHNLNNMLTGIMGPAQLLLEDGGGANARRWAQDIYNASERAADLVHRLYLSSRGAHDDQLGAVDVNASVEQAVRTARPRWKDEPEARGIAIQVDLRLAADAPQVRGTVSEMHDILLNLLLNSVEAMPAGGTITITTSRAADGAMVLTVADTGVGMDEETRRRVFEPFFTTRRDVGSGLGLATCYATATRWGGAIEASSRPGAGSTFELRLPGLQPETGEALHPAADEPARRGCVLIVDDEPSTCGLLSEILGARHDVAVAADGATALKQAGTTDFDVALVDLGLPNMPGDRVARRLKDMHPELAAILISGWELDDGDVRREPFDLSLQKPFRDVHHVRQAVNAALRLHDERHSGAQG